MDRVFESGALGTPPSAPGSPSTGYATAGNPATLTPATKPGPWWYHMITEELRNVVNDAGLTPNHLALNQLSQAIQALASSVEIRRISATVAANALTVSASALSLDFRSTTLGSGVVTKISGTPANLVIPSGATLGTVSGQQSDIVVLALNNAGTIELAVVNIAGGVNLDETGVISTTAISAGATSATVVYSTTARSNVAYRVLGILRSTQTTSGLWAAAMSLIQGSGGQALTSMHSLGQGQTWQNVTGSRAIGTTYYNTTGKPIAFIVGGDTTVLTGAAMQPTINGLALYRQWVYSNAAPYTTGLLIVPPGGSYSVSISGSGSYASWLELR